MSDQVWWNSKGTIRCGRPYQILRTVFFSTPLIQLMETQHKYCQINHRISVRGSVRPSVRPHVRRRWRIEFPKRRDAWNQIFPMMFTCIDTHVAKRKSQCNDATQHFDHIEIDKYTRNKLLNLILGSSEILTK